MLKSRIGMRCFLMIGLFALVILSPNLNGQSSLQAFFSKADFFFKTNVKEGLINYKALKDGPQLGKLIEIIGEMDMESLDAQSKKAFLINAYNLHVINQVVLEYPIGSVQEVTGFFDRKKVIVGGENITLNKLEKEYLLKKYNDPRLHFVLVCGALGCPPVTNFAYVPEKVETQIEAQTRIALNDDEFVKTSSGLVTLSEIFKWYKDDFDGKVLSYINNFRDAKLDPNVKTKYYPYDWSLNERVSSIADFNWDGAQTSSANNANRYVVSSTIPIGTYEVKIFNNLYSEKTGNGGELTDRSSFFTTSITALYGLSNRFNIGINTRIRKVRNNTLPSSPFSVFGSDEFGSSRSGLTAIGPQIRYAPNPKWTNFSIQSSFVFPIGNDLSGNDERPYIDWDGATWNTQFFNDFSIGDDFSLFTELDFLIEDIGKQNRLSTPVTVILSYLPIRNLTVYSLAGYSPYWQSEYDYFRQFGLGTKYQFNSSFEVELLYTDFSNKSLNEGNEQAATYNLGLRINI